MRCGEASAAPGSLEGGRVIDPAAVGQALRQLIARSEITTTRALVAASDAIASFRVLTFPKSTTDADIQAAIRRETNLGSDRMARRQFEVFAGRDARTVFAAVWDRNQVQAIATAVRRAGLEPAAIDLKSLCVARALTVDSCVFLDMTADPPEAVLVDERVPRLWHTFKVESSEDLALAIANGLKPLLAFHRRSEDGGFGPDSPIMVRSDEELPTTLIKRLKQLTGRPVEAIKQPPRVDPEVRLGPYLTCLGLVMRRRA